LFENKGGSTAFESPVPFPDVMRKFWHRQLNQGFISMQSHIQLYHIMVIFTWYVNYCFYLELFYILLFLWSFNISS
jgi:hypothetical protein